MNYITEINCFYDWLIENRISGNTQALWHRLMAYCNSFGWKREFTISNVRLTDDINISRQELDRIRTVLVEKGLISYKKGYSNQCGTYHIIPFGSRAFMRNNNDMDDVMKNDTQQNTCNNTHNSTHKSNRKTTKKSTKKENTCNDVTHTITEIESPMMKQDVSDTMSQTITDNVTQQLESYFEDIFPENDTNIVPHVTECITQNYTHDSTQNDTQNNTQTSHSCLPLSKPNNTIQDYIKINKTKLNHNIDYDSFDKVITFYKEHFSELTDYAVDKIINTLNDGNEADIIILCMQISVDANKASWNYVQMLIMELNDVSIRTKDGLDRAIKTNTAPMRYRSVN